MAFDAHANFAYSTVLTAPAPALTGLSLTVAAGQGALFPTAPFNCTVWPSGVAPISTNAEIVRVTAVVGDVLTIVRGQEGTAAVAIAAGYQIANTTTIKVFQDIEGAMIQGISAAGGVATASQVVFSNANGVSFGVAGQTVTASVAVGGGGLTNVNISAGTTSQNLSAFTFSNANGISFGLDAALSRITASYTVPAQSIQPVAASATNGSFLFSTVAFSNANGVTFGTSAGSIITASVAAGGAAGSISAGTTSVALGQAIFSNSNNVTFGLAGSTVTASVTVASSQGSINVSAGTTSNNLSAVTFSNANNVSFGLNAGTVTATVTVATSLTNINVSAGTTSNNLSAITFSNANGVTFGMNASTITASVAAAAGAQTGISGIQVSNTTYTSGTVTFQNANGISFGSSGANGISASYTVPSTAGLISAINVSGGTTSNNLSAITFSNSNNVSFGLNGSTITASATVASTQGSILLSAGTTSNSGSQFVFSNSNNVSFGLNGSTITATVTVAASPVNFSAGTTSNNLASVVFSNSNGVSFGLDGSTLTASVAAGGGGITALNFSAGTTSQNISDSIIFSNSNGVTFGLSGSTITAQVAANVYNSSYDNGPLAGASFVTNPGGTVSVAVAFILPNPISISFVRLGASMNTNSTTISTLASSANASAEIYTTFNVAVYSMGTGASSRSLTFVASGSNGWTVRQSISVATNGTQYSITQGISGQANGSGTSLSTQYSISNTNYSFTTNQIFTQFSGARCVDIDFDNSLAPGAYWLVFGQSTSIATNSTRFSQMTVCNVSMANFYGNSQANLSLGIMGSTNRTSGGLMGAGSFATAGGGTTANLPMSAISSMASNVKMYFQFLRSA